MSTTISQVQSVPTPVETKPVKAQQQPQKAMAFKGAEKADAFVKEYTVEATKGKKWGVGIASWCMTGLGQMINGQWAKGLGMFFGSALAGVGLAASIKKGSQLGMVGSGIAAVGLGLISIIDAVKNAKSKVRVVDQEALKAAENK